MAVSGLKSGDAASPCGWRRSGVSPDCRGLNIVAVVSCSPFDAISLCAVLLVADHIMLPLLQSASRCLLASTMADVGNDMDDLRWQSM